MEFFRGLTELIYISAICGLTINIISAVKYDALQRAICSYVALGTSLNLSEHQGPLW